MDDANQKRAFSIFSCCASTAENLSPAQFKDKLQDLVAQTNTITFSPLFSLSWFSTNLLLSSHHKTQKLSQ